MAKCNLGKVNLESMHPTVFPTNLHAGVACRVLALHVLINQPYSQSAFALPF